MKLKEKSIILYWSWKVWHHLSLVLNCCRSLLIGRCHDATICDITRYFMWSYWCVSLRSEVGPWNDITADGRAIQTCDSWLINPGSQPLYHSRLQEMASNNESIQRLLEMLRWSTPKRCLLTFHYTPFSPVMPSAHINNRRLSKGTLSMQTLHS